MQIAKFVVRKGDNKDTLLYEASIGVKCGHFCLRCSHDDWTLYEPIAQLVADRKHNGRQNRQDRQGGQLVSYLGQIRFDSGGGKHSTL